MKKSTYLKAVAFHAFLAAPLFCAAAYKQESTPGFNQANKQLSATGDYLLRPPSGVEKAFFQWGPVAFHPSATYTCTYGDGVPLAPGESGTTYIHEVRLGALFNLGPHWMVEYSPDWKRYTNARFDDRTDQDLAIKGIYQLQDWILSISQACSINSDFNLETARQIHEKDSLSQLSVTRLIGSRLSTDLELSQNLRYPDLYPISRDWRGIGWLNLHHNQSFNTGLGLSGGYLDIDPGVNSSSYGASIRARWQLEKKLTLSLAAGEEHRTFDHDAMKSMNTPIYMGSAEYIPTENTKLSIAAQQVVSPSMFRNELNKGREVSIRGRQRILGHAFVNASYIRRYSNFVNQRSDTPRSDTTDIWHMAVETPVSVHASLEVFYRRVVNNSSAYTYDLKSNQIGATIRASY